MSLNPREIIKQCLAEEGLSQSTFADEIGIHRVTLTRYLNEENDLSGDALLRALRLLGFEITPSASPKRRVNKQRSKKVKSSQAYAGVQNLVLAIDGEMSWHPKGRGGEWRIEAEGRRLVVEVPQVAEANSLDRLYKAKPDVDKPTRTEHFSKELRDDALERLREMLNQRGEPAVS